MPELKRYPKPGPMGGRLIREVIAFLRETQVPSLLGSHILIGVSGGSDSMALAHLLGRYGRRVVDRSRITLVHINHGWRGGESDDDARFVKAWAKGQGLRIRTFRLAKTIIKVSKKGESLENAARKARKRIYGKLVAEQPGAIVLTAHHGDDLAETLLWRLFTGASQTHGGGIAVRHGNELRPLLRVRKRMLQQYLKEEGESWREDRTNHEGRFLRSKLRAVLMPLIESLFPKAVDHLIQAALRAQAGVAGEVLDATGPIATAEILFAAAGLRARRSHFEIVREGGSEVHLPGGWKLTREQCGKKASPRWILEKR